MAQDYNNRHSLFTPAHREENQELMAPMSRFEKGEQRG